MIWLVATIVHAYPYSFPTTADDYAHWYPTAYRDNGGVDWNCGGITYPGHGGSDFGAGSFTGMDEGRDIVAAEAGTVITVHDGEFDRCTTGDCAGGGGYGNYVKIEHDDGKVTTYAHLKQWSVAVSDGQFVGCGHFLGLMGSSGYSTGPHLHFEVDSSEWGYSQDPFDGPCSDPPSYWLVQGDYDALPGLGCGNGCSHNGALACGQRVDSSNDSGGTWETTYYGCSEFAYSGPERVWSFTTSLDEPVTLSLTGLTADLDLYALTSTACDGSDCLASSVSPNADPEALTFQAAAGATYTIVVDGWDGAISGFALDVTCVGEPPPPPPSTGPTGSTGTVPGTTDGPPVDTALDDTGLATTPPASSDPTLDAGPSSPRDFAAPTGGCTTAPTLPLWAWGALLFRRQRRGAATSRPNVAAST